MNKNNEIVIAPQYDTLYFAGTGWCIAKRKNDYFLIDESLQSFFDRPMPNISYDGNGIVVDSARIKSWCKILPDKSLKCFKDQSSMQHYSVGTKNYYYDVQSPLIDSLVFVRNEPFDSSYYACYYNDGTLLEIPLKGCEPVFEKPYYLKYSVATLDPDPKWENKWDCIPAGIINLEKKDTVFMNGELQRTFNHKGENFLIVKGKDQKESVLNEKGDTLFSSGERIEYKSGFLTEGLRPSKKHRLFRKGYKYFTSDLYSFPDMKLTEKNISYPDDYGGSYISTNLRGRSLHYAEGKLIYRSRRGENPSVEVAPHRDYGNAKLFVIQTKKYISLISSTGKVLYKNKGEMRIEVNYRKEINNFIITISDRNRHVNQLAVYITSEDKIVFLDYNRIQFIHDDKLIACIDPEDEMEDCYIINAHGECISDSVYETLYWSEYNPSRTITEFFDRSDGTPISRVYDENMNQRLDNHNMDGLHTFDEIDTSFFTYRLMGEDELMGVMTPDFKVILPNKYKEIKYNAAAKYFVVIDKNSKIGFVRLDGTELFRP